MRTNIDIDEKLMTKAMAVTHLSTKKSVVEEAIKLLIKINQQTQLRKYKGKLKWTGDLDAMRVDK